MLFLYGFVGSLFSRPRPPVQHLENPGGGSFPSGHVANSTAVYAAILLSGFLAAHLKAVRPALFALAALLIAGVAVPACTSACITPPMSSPDFSWAWAGLRSSAGRRTGWRRLPTTWSIGDESNRTS